MPDNKDKILSSENFRKELNEDRKAQGLHEMPAINPGRGGGSTNTYARMDKSFDNAGDFFVKLFKRKKQRVKK